MNRATLKTQLVRDEGLRLKPYTDTVGKLTIGVGRNLTDSGITTDEAKMLLDNDLARLETRLRTELPWVFLLDEPRQHVLMNMAFNLGVSGLLGFPKMLDAVRRADYEAAAIEMVGSHWAAQVPNRASRLVAVMRTGVET